MTRNNNQEDYERNQGRLWLAVVDVAVSYAAYYRHKAQKPDDPLAHRIGHWTKITALGTWGGAILAGIAAFIFWLQLGEMQKQLKEARDEQRPWATIDAEIGSDLIFTNPGDQKSMAAHAVIKITVGNAGKFPAANLIIDGDCSNTLLYSDLFQSVMRKAQTARTAQVTKPLVGETIFPAQMVIREKTICTREGEWPQFLANRNYLNEPQWVGTLSPTYYGVVAYRYEGEPQSRQHETGFAFTIVRKDGKPIVPPETIPMSDIKVERINDPVNGVFFAN